MFDYNNDIKHDISVAAYFLAEKELTFDNLCWMLAERQLYLQNNFQKVDQNSIKQRAIKIYQTSPPYDVICWLISEVDFLLKRNYFKSNKKPHFILD
ncbi:MAG: hypothetical protein KGD74_07100 [Candidatus Lokiarchaeota archaeon]|nr:hypothetical protein [Candidatus Lokiarchaeota archaeon]